MKKKILVLNQGITENYGDIAINDTIITFLKNQGFQVDYFPFWLEELIFGKEYVKIPNLIMKIICHLQPILDLRMKRVIKNHIEISKYNAIIIGGGELLCGHRGFNTALYIWTKIAKKNNVPIYVLGVSGNKKMHRNLLKRNKKSLQRCTEIWVRDTYTYKICKNLYNVNCKHKPDVVFAYKTICRSAEKVKKSYIRNSLICVPISYEILKNKMNFKSQEEYFFYLCGLIDKKLKPNDEIIITSTVGTDNRFSNDFYEWLKQHLKNNSVTFKKYTNIDDYINLVNNAHTIISARMHALILGLIYGCDIVVIPFKEKLEIFEKEYSSKINLENIEREALESLEEISKDINRKNKSVEK